MAQVINYNQPYAGWKTWLTCALTGLFCFPACCPFDYHRPPNYVVVNTNEGSSDTNKNNDVEVGKPKINF